MAEESRVQLPWGLTGPLEVYVNGIPQREGVDYVRRERELVFSCSLAHEGRLGFWRWLSLFLGVAGTYKQNDSVDVVYEVDGKRTVESGLPILDPKPIGAEERLPGEA